MSISGTFRTITLLAAGFYLGQEYGPSMPSFGRFIKDKYGEHIRPVVEEAEKSKTFKEVNRKYEEWLKK